MTIIFSLFLLANCSNPNCIINIGDRYVDLSNLNIANNNYHYTDQEFGSFSFRLCGDLIDNDPQVPSCGLSEKGWAGAANGKDAQGQTQCYLTAATDSIKVEKISDTEFHLQYGSDTDQEPASVDEVRTIYEFHHVSTQTTEDPVSIKISDEAKNRFITLRFELNFQYLPNKPTPLPVPIFNPEFVQQSTTKQGMGIRFNLSEFKEFEQTAQYDGENIELQFSPGNFIDCPFPYNCRHYTPSSLYICRAGKTVSSKKSNLNQIHEEKGYCSSYGIAGASTTFDQKGLSESDGVNVYYKTRDAARSAKVFFSCDSSLPPHELKLKSKMTGDEDSINLEMRTSDTCIRVVTPVPDPEREYCHTDIKVHGTSLKIDLREYAQATGYKVNDVEIKDEKTGSVIEKNATFIISPCGALGCPTGFSCSTSKLNDQPISSFWKCSSSTHTCVSIASITTSDVTYEADNSVDGVVVRFGSSLFGNKNASIQYVCKEGLNTPIVESNATFDSTNNVYKIRIRHKDFCTASSSNKKKKLSGGAIFLIILVVVAFLYFGVGTAILSFKNKEFTFINKDFWVEFGLCIKEAVTRIFSCSKLSDTLMKSTYDKI